MRGHTLIVVVDAGMITDGAPGRLFFGRSTSDVDRLGEHGVRHHSTPGVGISWNTQSPSVPSAPATTWSETPSTGTSCRSG